MARKRPGSPFDRDKTRINDRIRAPHIRVVDENDDHLDVMPIQDAQRLARDRGLDLVEISPDADPPVCRIMDYGKFKYDKKKRDKESKKKQSVIHLKEVKLHVKTDRHDIDTKINQMLKFLEKGDRVKLTMVFRGREMVHTDLGINILKQIAERIKDDAGIEREPKMEGRTASMILAPLKKTKADSEDGAESAPQASDGPAESKNETQTAE